MAPPEALMRQRIEALVRRRTETDRRMGYVWMVVPLLPFAAAVTTGAAAVGIFVSILPRLSSLSQQTATPNSVEPVVGGILALYALVMLTLLIVWFFGALSFYYLIERRNRHFARQHLLFGTINRYLESKASASENVSQLSYLLEDSIYEEHARSAGLWALLFLLVAPIAGLIAAYNLTQDMRKHDGYQSKYQLALAPSMVDAGFPRPDIPAYNSRNRDPMLFIILSAITGGLFWIYWYYTLLKDYNNHFAEQAEFEDQIVRVLNPPQTPRTCGTCGGIVPGSARFCPNCGSKQAA